MVSQAEPLAHMRASGVRGRRFSVGLALLDLGLAVAAALSLATLWAAQAWLPDMVSFFRPALFYVCVMLFLAALVARRPRRLVAAVVLVAFNAWPLVVPATAFPAKAQPGAPTIRVMSANLLYDNTQFDRLRQVVKDVAPDVLVVQEEFGQWPGVIRSLEGLPYHMPMYVTDVVSRYPFTASFADLGPVRLPANAGGGAPRRVVIDPGPGRRPFVIYAIHPPTPRTLEGWQVRGAYLRQIAKLVRAEPEGTPVMVVGDWNTPTWSPLLRDFLDRSEMASAEASPWPAATRIFDLFGLPLPRWLGTPVDRVAVSRNIAVAGFEVGGAFGSDHLPVYADVALPAKP